MSKAEEFPVREQPMLPGAKLPERVLFAGSPAFGYVVPAIQMLARFWAYPTSHDVVLVHRGDRIGVERDVGNWWTNHKGKTHQVGSHDALLMQLADVDWVFLAIGNRCPETLAVMAAAEDLGLGQSIEYSGRFPYRPGTLQSEGKHPVQLAARARDAREREAKTRAARSAARQQFNDRRPR